LDSLYYNIDYQTWPDDPFFQAKREKIEELQYKIGQDRLTRNEAYFLCDKARHAYILLNTFSNERINLMTELAMKDIEIESLKRQLEAQTGS
jgi:hypothetical protein